MTSCCVVLPVLAVVSLGVAFAMQQTPQAAFDPSNDVESICSSATPFIGQSIPGEPSHYFFIEIHAVNPAPGQGRANVLSVNKDDVVQVEVVSTRPGTVTVHGIMGEHAVRVGGSVYVKLQAIHSGRFPLHFHGRDGSHIEVATFEITRGL